MVYYNLINKVILFGMIIFIVIGNYRFCVEAEFERDDNEVDITTLDFSNNYRLLNDLKQINELRVSDCWLQTTNSDFNNGTKYNINVSNDSFHLNETVYYCNETLIKCESFEEIWPPYGWIETGAWNKESNRVHTGEYSADFDGWVLGQHGNLHTPSLDCSDEPTSAIHVDFWGYDQGSDSGEYYLDYSNGTAWNQITPLDDFGENSWAYYNDTITDSDYFVSNFRIRWRVVGLDYNEHVYVDDVTVKLQNKAEGYKEYGYLISEAHDTGQEAPIYTSCIIENETPNGSSMQLWIRSAKTKEDLNTSEWFSNVIHVPQQQWVQWKIELTSNKICTPIIYSVNLSWIFEQEPPTPEITYIDDDYDISTPGWGYDHFNLIQEGINAVNYSGTVYVYNGSYKENIVINKKINLLGEDPYSTIVDGRGLMDVIHVLNDSVTICGFTIKNSGGLPEGYSGIRIVSNNCIIKENIIQNNHNGIFCYQLSNTTIYANHIIDHIESTGIILHNSSNNYIIGNNISNNFCGIQLESSSYNKISRNNLTYNDRGILLYYTSYTTIFKNIIENNKYGIRLLYSSEVYGYTSYNTIDENTISRNDYIGFETDDASNNVIFHNNFINNLGGNAKDSSDNKWDNEYPSGGNFWDDYEGEDSDEDGIGDSPYNVPGGNNQDRYPLMDPYGIDIELPVVHILIPEKKFLYLNFNDNFEFKIPFFFTFIIGKIEINVEAFDNDSGIDKVEFYIDNKYKAFDHSIPYSWTWDEQLFLSPVEIKVKAYDCSGNYKIEKINIWKLF